MVLASRTNHIVFLIIMCVKLCNMLTLSTTIINVNFLTANTILVKISLHHMAITWKMDCRLFISTLSASVQTSSSYLIYSLGLYQLIDRPSRITNQSSTLIDTIFTNAKEYTNASGLLVNDITDHLPIFAFCDYRDLKLQEKKLYTKSGL